MRSMGWLRQSDSRGIVPSLNSFFLAVLILSLSDDTRWRIDISRIQSFFVDGLMNGWTIESKAFRAVLFRDACS